jgi:hypothetical protein
MTNSTPRENTYKNMNMPGTRWLTLVIPAAQEAEGRSVVQASPGNNLRNPISKKKTKTKKRAGDAVSHCRP